MPIPVQQGGFWTIQSAYEESPDRSHGTLADILNAMRDMERATMGFLDPVYGLQNCWGSDLPDELNGEWPNIVHLPGGSVSLGSILFGDALHAHPGGVRQHTHLIKVYVIVGSREENLEQLLAKCLFWLKAFDLAYCRNGSLGGVCHGAKILNATWGPINYAGLDYFGWTFTVQVVAQYTMTGEGP